MFEILLFLHFNQNELINISLQGIITDIKSNLPTRFVGARFEETAILYEDIISGNS